MKKTIKLLALLLCIAPFAVGITSCESQKQKEARAKAEAEEKQTVEQLKTPDGLRKYLKGRTFVYCHNPHYIWVKLTFRDTDLIVMYDAWSKDRNWGNSKRFTYQLREDTDNYGEKTGYIISLNEIDNKDVGLYKYFTFSNANRSLTAPPRDAALGGIAYGSDICLIECDEDFIPSQWKD